MTSAGMGLRSPPLPGGTAEGTCLRLMIVDDSPVARAVLTRMISSYPEFEIVAAVADAGEAVERLRSMSVDIVLLDVEMPGRSGIDALPEILRAGEGAHQVLIVSSYCEDGAEATVRALALGAADTLPKPGASAFAGRFAEVLASRLRRVGRDARERAEAQRAADRSFACLRRMPLQKPACLALGASTGGLHALNAFFAALPPRIDIPILITQHLPAAFMPYFARQIAAVSGRVAHVARDGLVLEPDQIVVASGEAHLGFRRQAGVVAVELVKDPSQSGCLPSVDTMLSGVAAVYGSAALGVIFSGMGRDGLAGSADLVGYRGGILVQDQQSSAIWGMPRVVAEAGLASAILPPDELAKCVSALIRGAAWR